MSTLIVDQVEDQAGNLITVPVGGIIMWSGSIAQINNLPGWNLCDGSNGTPDLRDKFVIGAGSGSGSGTVPTAGPGFNPANGALNSSYTPGSVGGETAHKLTIAELASHNHTAALYRGQGASFAGGTVFDQQLTPAAGVTFTGGDQFHENRPPYYALAFIMRIP